MILYHGTSQFAYENNIREAGIRPRGHRCSGGNWETNTSSNSELVYLAANRLHPVFHAFRSRLAHECDVGMVLHIDTSKINMYSLRVDENFLDMEQRGTLSNCDPALRRKQRKAALHDHRWEESIKKTTLASYYGVVPPEAIIETEVVPVDESNPFFIPEALDSRLSRNERMLVHDWWLHFHADVDEDGWKAKLEESGLQLKQTITEQRLKQRDFEDGMV